MLSLEFTFRNQILYPFTTHTFTYLMLKDFHMSIFFLAWNKSFVSIAEARIDGAKPVERRAVCTWFLLCFYSQKVIENLDGKISVLREELVATKEALNRALLDKEVLEGQRIEVGEWKTPTQNVCHYNCFPVDPVRCQHKPQKFCHYNCFPVDLVRCQHKPQKTDRSHGPLWFSRLRRGHPAGSAVYVSKFKKNPTICR